MAAANSSDKWTINMGLEVIPPNYSGSGEVTKWHKAVVAPSHPSGTSKLYTAAATAIHRLRRSLSQVMYDDDGTFKYADISDVAEEIYTEPKRKGPKDPDEDEDVAMIDDILTDDEDEPQGKYQVVLLHHGSEVLPSMTLEAAGLTPNAKLVMYLHTTGAKKLSPTIVSFLKGRRDQLMAMLLIMFEDTAYQRMAGQPLGDGGVQEAKDMVAKLRKSRKMWLGRKLRKFLLTENGETVTVNVLNGATALVAAALFTTGTVAAGVGTFGIAVAVPTVAFLMIQMGVAWHNYRQNKEKEKDAVKLWEMRIPFLKLFQSVRGAMALRLRRVDLALDGGVRELGSRLFEMMKKLGKKTATLRRVTGNGKDTKWTQLAFQQAQARLASLLTFGFIGDMLEVCDNLIQTNEKVLRDAALVSALRDVTVQCVLLSLPLVNPDGRPQPGNGLESYRFELIMDEADESLFKEVVDVIESQQEDKKAHAGIKALKGLGFGQLAPRASRHPLRRALARKTRDVLHQYITKKADAVDGDGVVKEKMWFASFQEVLDVFKHPRVTGLRMTPTQGVKLFEGMTQVLAEQYHAKFKSGYDSDDEEYGGSWSEGESDDTYSGDVHERGSRARLRELKRENRRLMKEHHRLKDEVERVRATIARARSLLRH